MDDSDQDFVDLCSKLLKRVRKKPGEPRQLRKAEHQPSSQASEGDKKRKNNKKDGDFGSNVTGTQPLGAGAGQLVVSEGTRQGSGDAGPSIVPSTAAGPRPERVLTAKDKVLHKMQQFKRVSPQRMVPTEKRQPANHCGTLPQLQEAPESLSSGLHCEVQDSDEALALRLQQELDREAAGAQTVDLDDGGLFFCQICHKDLSHMTPAGRTQHLNRCLDESEESAPAPPPPPPPPGVPECPICGKKFKSQKSRSAHLKRCSSDMGISPAVLLQALQRQAEETQNVSTANTLVPTGGIKRKGPSKPGLPARKKPKKKTEPLDEDTLVALALSSSLLEQDEEHKRDKEAELQLQAETAVCHTSMTSVLKRRPDQGKGRGKKKKGTIPRPPPLLLVQDAQAALSRLQERVSALLLRSWPHSPPTPTRCPSRLPGWTGAAPLWQKSALLDRGSTCLSDFYTPELGEFITPWESAKIDAASSNTIDKPESSVQPVNEGTPATETRASILPSSSQTASCSSATSTPGTRHVLVGSQTLRDLMELAEDGMTLTQCDYTASEPKKDLHLSGFVLGEAEEQEVLCLSGFLPETTRSQVKRKTDRSGAEKERCAHQSAALSRLTTDLSSMVNNPQLSDVQLQVDSGDVYFAHSFMIYARCPLLAEMLYESGFGVQEDGMRAAQRVLMNDVPGQAVFALLQYLYTGHCSIPASLQSHVLELASRFDLKELQQLCEIHQDEADYTSQEEDVNNQTDQAFIELLRSMWNEEDEGEEETDTDGGKDVERELGEDHRCDDLATSDREVIEEKVNEEELDEIYEFATTQRNRVEESDSEQEEERGEVDEEGDHSSSPSTSSLSNKHPPQSQQHRPFRKISSELSGRTLLQSSSSSAVDDLSVSHPPSTSNLPVPGVSPGQVDDCGSGGEKRTDDIELDECLPLKQESQGPRIPDPLSPPSPQNTKKKEPEVIVLSDSSEEMEVALCSRSPSPHFPCTVQSPQDYTQIKSQQVSKHKEPTLDNREPTSLELSPGDPVDCSPEVSWLIPSTPVQHGRSTRTSSSQTKSSMCRTRLFPKDEASSPLPVFSSPTSSANKLQSSNSPNRAATQASGSTEGSVSRMKLDKIVSSSINLDLAFSPERTSSYDASKDREVFAVPSSQFKVSHLSNLNHLHSLQVSSKQDTPLHRQPQPYSSTPLHAELHQPFSHLAASLLHKDPDKQTDGVRERVTSESTEKTELESFHLSPLSDPLDPPSSSFSHRGLQSSQRQSKSFSESLHLVESSSHNNTGTELKRRVEVEAITIRNETGENKDQGNEGEQEEAIGESGATDGTKYSFQQSFMDEPPIAFNDSWGLDVCIEEKPGCFSLRLEDSRGSSQQERSLGQGGTVRSPPSTSCQPPRSSCCMQSSKSSGSMVDSSPSNHPPTSVQAHTSPSITPSPPGPAPRTTQQVNNSLLDSKIWDSWEEEEEEDALPLSQRVNPQAQLKTPASSLNKKRPSLEPITPMPHYSDLDTPELKNKLNRFGVRPLPKRQMILKLKEIHQYTHQLVSSDSEDEAPPAGRKAQTMTHVTSTAAAGKKPKSCTRRVEFKEPRVPAVASPLKHNRDEEEEPLSASQGSNTSSTAASEESERSNPELCLSSDGDSDSDGGISASQAANRLQDRLRAVRSFILSDSGLYNQILQYQPLVLSQLQERLKAAGIRLGAAKLVDYLDSQCVTFTTAKPGQSAPSRRRGKRTGKGAKTAGGSGASRKKNVAATMI